VAKVAAQTFDCHYVMDCWKSWQLLINQRLVKKISLIANRSIVYTVFRSSASAAVYTALCSFIRQPMLQPHGLNSIKHRKKCNN